MAPSGISSPARVQGLFGDLLEGSGGRKRISSAPRSSWPLTEELQLSWSWGRPSETPKGQQHSSCGSCGTAALGNWRRSWINCSRHGLRQPLPALGGCCVHGLCSQDGIGLHIARAHPEPQSPFLAPAVFGIMGFRAECLKVHGAEPHGLQGMGGKRGGKEVLRPGHFHFLKQLL